MSPKPQPSLRRQNRIRTIRDSLAIEGNTLSIEQVSALFDNKRVVGPKRDIIEVANTIRAYASAQTFDPVSSKSLLKAHKVLMEGLIEDAGRWRASNVGILKGSKISHLAPQAKWVAGLMQDLFEFLKLEREIHPLIRSSVFHYDLEFIHPFSDGNGRVGRFWQHVILLRFHPLFENIPVESIIKKNQQQYYRVLEKSDKAGHCDAFIEFSLESILVALQEFLDDLKPEPVTVEARLETARSHFKKTVFSRKDYISFFKSLSTATASRDLQCGVRKKILKKSGDRALARYVFG